MASNGREHSNERRRTPTGDDLERVVSAIQTNGGNVLVTGDISQQTAITASQQVFGSTDVTRKRLLALTDSGIERPDAYLPDGVTTDDPDVWFIDQRHDQRSVSAIPSVSDADLPTPTAGDDLDILWRDITEAISVFSKSSDLEPGELRVVVNPLTQLLTTHGLDDVTHALKQILPLVQIHHGIGHYFLDGHDHADDLRPLFDAHIELRNRRDHPIEQRWYLPEYPEPGPWLTFTKDW